MIIPLSIVALAHYVFALSVPRQVRNDGIHLAVLPNCGSFSGTPADVNAGLLPLAQYKTIVVFGDSFTDGGGAHDGGTRPPAVVIPPNPSAGGRITNGPVWVEDLGTDTGAVVKDYAISGAVTNASLWPGDTRASDFVTQSSLFLSQSNQLDPATTLYAVFFGINDFDQSLRDGPGNLPAAAQTILDQIKLLTRPPTNARSFLVIDDYAALAAESPTGDAFKQAYFSGLNNMRSSIPGFRVAFVDFKTIWNGVLTSSPGFAAFGYTSSGACLTGSTTAGACSDPEHTFSWFSGHPSKETHRIMADYIEEVLVQCV